MLFTTFLLSLREIRRHLMRSFLTTLGIIIGVASVITMVTLGRGVTASVQDQISSLGSNIFFIVPQDNDAGSGGPFKADDVLAVEQQVAGINFVAGVVNANATAFHNGQDWDTSVRGADNAFLDAQSTIVEQGRRFTKVEMASGKSVCIIGTKVQEMVFVPGVSPLGEDMRLGNVPCKVIGVFEDRGQGANGSDDNDIVQLPLKTVQRRFTGSNDLQYFVAKYDTAYSSDKIMDALIGLLRERRLVQPGENNNFDIIDTAQINETISSITGALTGVVAAIAGISLIVGGIGIMNIMLVSVTERTREIGIRLAIGAMASEVRMQFLTEAVVLCCFGGLVGILLALGLSFGLSSLIDLPFVFDPMVNGFSFLFSAAMGVIFGFYPAYRASKLDPIEALRHE